MGTTGAELLVHIFACIHIVLLSYCADVHVSRQKIYFALKTDRISELRSLSLGGAAEEVFDGSIEKQVDDEIVNGLSYQ